MVGITTRRNPDGLVIFKGAHNVATNLPENGMHIEIFLDKEECQRIYECIKEAKRKYWNKEIK